MQLKFRILLLITLKSMRTGLKHQIFENLLLTVVVTPVLAYVIVSTVRCLSCLRILFLHTCCHHPCLFYYLHITLTSLVLPFQFYILIWSIIHHINADSTHLVSNFVLCHDDKHYVSVETAGNMLNWRQNFFNPNSGIMVTPIVTKNWHPYYCTVSMLPLKG